MIRRFKKLNIMQRAALIILLFTLFCQFAGSTFAWYQSEDERNNHFGVKDNYVDVVLTETNWDSTGKQQAQAMQPGMDIFKNPRVVNTSDDYCFVRMSLEVLDSEGKSVDDERKTAVLSALKYTEGSALFTASDDEDYSVGASGLNSDFTACDGWYYYAPNGICTALEPLASTSELFTDVVIPCLKSNYQYFEDGFKLVVYAEAVYTTETAKTMSVEDLADRFVTVGKSVDENVDSKESTNLTAFSLFGLDDDVTSDTATSVGAFKEK